MRIVDSVTFLCCNVVLEQFLACYFLFLVFLFAHLPNYCTDMTHQENTFHVNSLVGLIHLTVVMNFPVRNIFLPFFLINFRLSETHQYFLSVTFFQKFHLLAIPKVMFSICTAPETDLNNESLAQATMKTQHTS